MMRAMANPYCFRTNPSLSRLTPSCPDAAQTCQIQAFMAFPQPSRPLFARAKHRAPIQFLALIPPTPLQGR